MNSELSYDPRREGADAPPAPQNFFSRLIGVYFSPGETFAGMASAPRPLAAIIALILLFVVSGMVGLSRASFEQIAEQQLQQRIASGQINEAQAEQQREATRKMAPYMKYVIPIGSAIWATIMVFAFAGLAKLLSMMMGIENKYLPLVSVTAYSLLAVYIVSSVIFTILVFIKPVEEFDWSNPLASNLAALLSAMGVEGLPSFVKALFTYVDVFYIWKVALMAIGGAAVSHKLKTSSAMIYAGFVAFIIALIGGVFGMLGGA
ncbi:MAG TPA: YIP1 family protein [Blastocatellia bacterium]